VDYYQGVVTDYLRADRAIFVNTECCIQLDDAHNPKGGRHWFCDAVAADFRDNIVFLCEVSYATGLSALLKRLVQWNAYWPQLTSALVRDCKVPENWQARPWLFIPEGCIASAVATISKIDRGNGSARSMPDPRITSLEMVAPWQYTSWKRIGEKPKPEVIPVGMRR
jgi:hypothetical protein